MFPNFSSTSNSSTESDDDTALDPVGLTQAFIRAKFIYNYRKRVNMLLPPLIWTSSGLFLVKKKFRFQPCNMKILSF